MQHKDYVKAAKELNKATALKLKVVAVKGDVLKKSIQDAVKELTDFDFSTLSPPTLDVFDDLKCEMAEEPSGASLKAVHTASVVEKEIKKKAKVIPIKKEERSIHQQGPALFAAAADVVDVLGYPAETINKFNVMSLTEMVVELQKMADEINEPYEEEGKTITPDDKPEMFKPDTLTVFEANSINVKWNETKKEAKKKSVKKVPSTKAKVQTKKDEKETPKKKETKKPELQFHEYANLFPAMAKEDFNEIVKDMNENGYRTDRPIILYGGKIADGRNRYNASIIAGVDATYTNFDGTEPELFKHVIALNLKRRHLTPAQRATLAAELLPEFEKVGKAKQKAAGKGNKTEKAYRATEEAAKATGSTKDAVTAAKKIQKKDPEKFQEMKAGKKTIAAAKRETEEKTALDKFNDAEKVLKAKLKMVRTSIHELVDAAELAEQTVTYQDSLDLIENAILTILG